MTEYLYLGQYTTTRDAIDQKGQEWQTSSEITRAILDLAKWDEARADALWESPGEQSKDILDTAWTHAAPDVDTLIWGTEHYKRPE